MSQTKLVLLAGAALGVGSAAFAQSADGNRAYSAELMADAQSRTSYQGDNVVNISGLMQFRYVANFRDEDDDDFTQGFQTRRTRLAFHGDVDGWGYFVQTEADYDGGEISLLDAYVTHELETGWTVKFGQSILPFLKEYSTSAGKQLAVDRSNVSTIFNQGRSQGIWVEYEAENMVFTGALSEGIRTAGTDFNSSQEADYAFTGRLDYIVRGAAEQFDDFTSWMGSEYGVVIGGAGHYQSHGDTNPENPDITFWGLTADAQVEGDGWNVYGAGVWTSTDIDGQPTYDDFGALIQGGYFLSEQDEIFGRWDAIFGDDNRNAAKSTLNFITLGYNHYFIPRSHAVKFTADLVWAMNETLPRSGLNPATTETGLIGDDDEGEMAVRGQMQILF